MGIPGSYLTLKLDNEIIAESIDVSLKAKAKHLDTTSQGAGINAGFMAGMITLGVLGEHLYASDGANWDILYDLHRTGEFVTVQLYRDETLFLDKSGIIKRLRLKGSDAKENVTGMFGITVSINDAGAALLAEDGFQLLAEDGKVLLTE